MKIDLRKYDSWLPSIQMGVTFLLSFIQLSKDKETDLFLFLVLSNTIGYSVFTSRVYYRFYFRKGICFHTKAVCSGLIAMAFFNVIGLFINEGAYIKIFDKLTFGIVLIVLLLDYIQKKLITKR